MVVEFLCKKNEIIQGVSKNLLECGEQYIAVSQFSFFFIPGCLARRGINAPRIVYSNLQ